MTAIEEIITTIDEAIEKITEASGATAGATTQTEEALNTAAGLGAGSMVEGLTAVQAALEDLAAQLAGAGSQAEQVREMAEAAGGDT